MVPVSVLALYIVFFDHFTVVVDLHSPDVCVLGCAKVQYLPTF